MKPLSLFLLWAGIVLLMGCEADQSRPAPVEQAKGIVAVAEPEPASEAPAVSPAAPVDALEPEPTIRSYFERVLDIKVEIDPDQWDELRWQVRTWDSIFLPSGEHRLDGPAVSPYTWFMADVTVDGHIYRETGIRKKGRAGSQDDDKPSLKLRFDKYVDDQSLPGGLERPDAQQLQARPFDDRYLSRLFRFRTGWFGRPSLPFRQGDRKQRLLGLICERGGGRALHDPPRVRG